jgi:hypothetical protein
VPRPGGFFGLSELSGGKAEGMTVQDLADRHKVDADTIRKAVEKGTKVESEHTDDKSVARQIAMDHVFEDPNYYDKLAKMEKDSD